MRRTRKHFFSIDVLNAEHAKEAPIDLTLFYRRTSWTEMLTPKEARILAQRLLEVADEVEKK